MEFGTKLKDSRIKANLTQEEVAEHIQVSRQTISNWENNRSLPDLRSIVLISSLYHVSLDYLLIGEEKVMNKLYNDTDVKKATDRVLVVTILSLISSIGYMIFLSDKDFGIVSIISLTIVVLISILLIVCIYNMVRVNRFHNKVMEDKKNQQQNSFDNNKLALFISFGTMIGTALGLLVGLFFKFEILYAIPVGSSIGLLFGVVIGTIVSEIKE
ncbi:helix-turn-helix domain-containing protein [Vagococcus elongatus]|uniref:HTH cro/C1-type domain-containing protein n=1 Tax=Vagococcus elongatus TaxID=180344 RepID=A0A430AZM6_9ENTE|nr:helix-turn-helix transcriptional regulator [Vagococcus elongatus]RSU13515.1 hypothetical protein CBF29_04480 [Vagococcus elongatus]